MERFKNRYEAGRLLAERLTPLKIEHPLVLAIPRGGAVVAHEVAHYLGADLDILVVKKIPSPWNPELAVGAVCADGRLWMNRRILDLLNIKSTALKALVDEKAEEAHLQARRLRGSRPIIPVQGRTVILIDDGIATGATFSAAIELLRTQNPRKIIIASPVAPASILEDLQKISDEVICLRTPYHFYSVSDWYVDFPEVPDREVLRLLERGTAPEVHP